MSREIKYSFAYDENNKLIDINNVSHTDRLGHHFRCINCNAEMQARLGNKNRHHFAHKSDVVCDGETYLHKLGKVLLKKKFEESPEFIIEYERHFECAKHESCKFYSRYECHSDDFEAFDLKKYYDTCTEEQKIEDYTADLLLSNSNNCKISPVLIEIWVTHKCTTEKRESGAKIIEIHVKDEDSLRNLTLPDARITESENIKFSDFNRAAKRKELNNRYLARFIIYQSGDVYVSKPKDSPTCNVGKMYPKAIRELQFDYDECDDTITIYDYRFAVASQLGYEVKNCNLCKYLKQGYDEPIICCLYKKYGTPKKPKQLEANSCKYYRPDNDKIEKIIDKLKDVPVQEVE